MNDLKFFNLKEVKEVRFQFYHNKTRDNISLMNTNNEIQTKQNLIQTEINNFCPSKKDNGINLNNIKIDEIKKILREFVSEQNQVEATSKPKCEEVKHEEQKEGEAQKMKKEDFEKMEKVLEEDSLNLKERIIECRKLNKTILNDKKLFITVSNPKEKEGGVFSKNYILYEVHTDPLGWTVHRRFSDFENLRKLIAKNFPSFYIPPLLNKKSDEVDFISNRMYFLNLFINDLVKNESFKCSEILMTFLSYENRGKFDSKFKEYTLQKPSQNIEEYKTLDGKVTILYDEQKKNIS